MKRLKCIKSHISIKYVQRESIMNRNRNRRRTVIEAYIIIMDFKILSHPQNTTTTTKQFSIITKNEKNYQVNEIY